MADKLYNTHISSEASWSLLKRFLKNKKVPLIPPIFHLCSSINNNSKLPTNFSYVTEKRLVNATFSIEEIGNIMQGLDPNKVHSQDKISICMLEICGNAICKLLEVIYKKYPLA